MLIHAYIVCLGLLSVAPPPPAPIEVTYVHSLASSSGVLPLTGVSLSYEPTHQELFVSGNGLVRVFSESGMQIYEFGEDPGVGGILSAVPLPNGDLVALSFIEGKISLLKVNFRGEPVGKVELRGIPEEFAGFVPTVIRFGQGQLYLADTTRMKVLVVDPDGAFVSSYDLAEILELDQERANTGLRGFNVDSEGNLLVTIQPLFRAFVIAPDRTVRSFGMKGSTAGKFNVVGGITRDLAGNIYVADILRSVVMVFAPDLRFVREFGYRGQSPNSLAGPDELAVGNGKLYVANNSKRGVSVFKVTQK
ncbi:MAG: hypothetical protein H6Q89_2576 [Myxococcaceae bacterium]|nr:hypothetical protein [Myxococcaceae bacterium]